MLMPNKLPGWALTEAFWAFSTVTSVVLFVLGLAAVPILCTRLPEDFLVRSPPIHPPATQLLRMTIGVLVVVLGVTLLVLPGPGVLVILLGVSLMDFPGKQVLVRRLLARPHVIAAINHVRHVRGRPPLRTE